MKHILLTATAVAMCTASYAQLSWGTPIGKTYYDLQTNAASTNRLVRNDDGSLSATWIEHWDFLSSDNNPKNGVRGFGYNHYDPSSNTWVFGDFGECWEDPFGCGTSYSGWPEMINLNGQSQNEQVYTHSLTDGVIRTQRSAIGTGTWANTAPLDIDKAELADGITWPRAVSSGNYIHLIGALNAANTTYVDAYGVSTPMRYYRSSDGGQTWDIQGTEFDFTETIVEVIYDTTYVPVVTNIVVDIDTLCASDTIASGAFSVGSSTFDADVLMTDSSLSIVDTIFTISSHIDSSGLPFDTMAIVQGCYYDTTFQVDLVEVIDTNYIYIDQLMVDDIGGDAYAIYAKDNVVAITLGGGPGNDWVLLKSIDYGSTWAITKIKDNHNLPVVFAGQAGDGHFTNGEDFDIIIDAQGTVHTFAGMMLRDETFVYGDAELFKQLHGGILHWKEGMTEPVVVATPDYGYDGDTSTYSISGASYYGIYFIGWPSASFDANGGIYLTYSAIAEFTEFINPTNGDTLGYNDLYMVYSKDGGDTWLCTTDPINLAEDVYAQEGSTPIQDDLYPNTVPQIADDQILHLTWQGDWSRPGIALRDNTHPNDQENYIMYAGFDVTDMLASQCTAPVPAVMLGVSDLEVVHSLQLVPNPVRDKVMVQAETAMSVIELIDMLGAVKMHEVTSAAQHVLDVSALPQGIYIVRAQTAQGMAMQRLVVE